MWKHWFVFTTFASKQIQKFQPAKGFKWQAGTWSAVIPEWGVYKVRVCVYVMTDRIYTTTTTTTATLWIDSCVDGGPSNERVNGWHNKSNVARVAESTNPNVTVRSICPH